VNAGGEIQLGELWSALTSHRRVIAVCVILFSGAAVAFALLSPKIYRADTLLAPAPAVDGTRRFAGAAGGLAAFIGAANLMSDGTRTTEALAVLRSRAFTLKFIQDENLMQVLFADRWDAQNKRWLNPERPPTLEDAYRKFDSDVRRVIDDEETGLVRLEIYWTSPSLAARWANLLVERLNSQMRASAIAEAKASLGYLDRELQKANVVEMRQVLFGLVETQTKREMLANVEREFVFTVVDPAMVPDIDKHVKPKRPFIALAGVMLGLIVGCLISLFMTYSKRARRVTGAS
jgi:uncharacterized protein involved in exopolysaccharide biosynthesis